MQTRLQSGLQTGVSGVYTEWLVCKPVCQPIVVTFTQDDCSLHTGMHTGFANPAFKTLFTYLATSTCVISCLVLSWWMIGRRWPPRGVSRQWAVVVVRYGMWRATGASLSSWFWRQLGSPAQQQVTCQQQQGAGSYHQPFWLQMNCEAQMKMPLLP